MKFISPFSIPDPVIYVIPVFVLFVIGEWFVLTRRRHERYDYPEAAASIGMGLGVIVVNLFSKMVYLTLFTWVYQFRIFVELGTSSFASFYDISWQIEHIWVWMILFFADDLIFYWFHRLAHEVRILWAGHVNHHSSQEFNFAIALRQGWWEDVYKYIFWCGLPLLGFHPIMIFMMMQMNLTYQFFVHTETIGKLGILEWIMNTPSHHRVHHGSDLICLDKNYGGTLIIWDRIFGTFQEETFKPHYGLTENIHTHNIFKIASHELISLGKDVIHSKNIRSILKYLFLAPGWSPDHGDKRARTLQKKLAREMEKG